MTAAVYDDDDEWAQSKIREFTSVLSFTPQADVH